MEPVRTAEGVTQLIPKYFKLNCSTTRNSLCPFKSRVNGRDFLRWQGCCIFVFHDFISINMISAKFRRSSQPHIQPLPVTSSLLHKMKLN